MEIKEEQKFKPDPKLKLMDPTRQVLDQPIEDQLEPVKARRHARPPTVMTQSEVQRVMAHLEGRHLRIVL